MKKDPFKEYILESEPTKKELGYSWYTAIGLQIIVRKAHSFRGGMDSIFFII